MADGDTVDFKIAFFHKFKSLEWNYLTSLSNSDKKRLSHSGRLEDYHPTHILECK